MDFKFCRVCLATNIRMHSIVHIGLQNIFEKVTSAKINSEDSGSATICYICCSQLKRCLKFSEMSERAEKMFTDLLAVSSSMEITQNNVINLGINPSSVHKLSITSEMWTSLSDPTDPTSEVTIKEEDKKNDFEAQEVLPEVIPILKEEDNVSDDSVPESDPDREVDSDRKFPFRCRCGKTTKNYARNSKTHHICDRCNKLPKILLTKKQSKSLLSKLKTNDGKTFECKQCSKTFLKNWNLKRHLRLHSGEKCYTCNRCGKAYTDNSALRRHMTIHLQAFITNTSQHLSGEKSYPCKRCAKTFADARSLHRHIRFHCGEKKYSCDQCSKAFFQESNLKKHIKIHSTESKTCSVCSKIFSTSRILHQHMKLHSGFKPFACDRCAKTFSTNNTLKTHMRTHTRDKPYPCTLCQKSFSHSSSLQSHTRTHTGEKPYACDQCGKTFAQNSNLQQHMRIHTGHKPYACTQCDRAFTCSTHLIMHRRVHSGERPYQCPQCHKAFTGSSQLNIHMRTHTGEKPYPCQICEKTFSHSNSLQTHMKIHKSVI